MTRLNTVRRLPLLTDRTFAIFIVSLAAPELIYALCFRPHRLEPNNGLTSTWAKTRQTVEVAGCSRSLRASRCAIRNQMASDEDLKAEIERLRTENKALKMPARGQMSLKVSEKGGLSVYGLGRFPVTLYKEQWVRLLAMADEIRNFIRENDSALKTKE